MKKVLLILTICFTAAMVSYSQQPFSGTATNPTGAVLNATSDTLNFTANATAYSAVRIQCLLTKTSGTIAGTVTLYGSVIGATGTYEAIGSALTLSNAATNAASWAITTPTWKYYRIVQTGGTTMAGILSAKIFAPK